MTTLKRCLTHARVGTRRHRRVGHGVHEGRRARLARGQPQHAGPARACCSWPVRSSRSAGPTCATTVETAGARLAAVAPRGSCRAGRAAGDPAQRADAISRATAVDPKELTRQQAAVAHWISRRYRVAPEPISRLVQEAWQVGQRAGLDPTLILAIMAVESSFNPFAQSTGRRPGPDAGDDQDPRRQVRGLRRQPRRVRPGDQPARGRAGAQGVHHARRQPGGRPALLRRRRQPAKTTAATPARCWPSRTTCAWSPAASRCRPTWR